MKETEWAEFIAVELDRALTGYSVEAGRKLIYANEIVEYGGDASSYNEMAYETDILVFESNNGSWKPRVVIETKIDSITTHDSITYSQKAAAHKYVHPYLRYGIFLGHRGHHPLPGRLFRHGAQFDFMLSWEGYEPDGHEWKMLIKIIRKEIKASQQLEEMIFNSRCKQRAKYVAVHRPLITIGAK